MIAYILEGVHPQAASGDKRMDRLRNVGPWQYQMARNGAFATWRTGLPVSRSAFGKERPTSDGMIYLPPKVLPSPSDLLRPEVRERTDLTEVEVLQDSATMLHIMPSYRTPRQIMEDNTYGDYTTAYGRSVRALLDKAKEDPRGDYLVDMTECARLAIMHSYRCTRELLSDLGWLNEASIVPLWRAALSAPKDLLLSVVEESGSAA